MADIITRLKFETDEFSNKARRMTTEINDITHKMELAGNSIDHTNAKSLKLAQSFGTVQTASTTLRGKISELQESFVAWSHHYNQLTAEQKRDPYGKAIVEQLDILKVRIRDTKKELAGIEGKMGGGVGFGSKFVQGFVPGIGMGAGAAGAMLAVKGVTMALGLMKDAVKYNIQTNAEFEQSNANLAAILGTTRDKIKTLTENAKALGASTLYTAQEITELQTVLARRGFNEQQILDMTHGISNLALATGTGLADAAELAASTMQAFSMKATDMEHIVEVLGVSTTKCALTTEKLGTSLQYVAPTAKAAGFTLEDTVAMLGKLVDAGLDASTAGTSLRQILLAMATANGKLARSFGHPVRGMQDFIKAITDISHSEDILSEMSQEVRVTAVPAMIALANNADGLNKLRDALDDVNGKLQKMADEQASTLIGQLKLLRSAWDGWMLSIGNGDGILKKGAEKLTDMLAAFNKIAALDNGVEAVEGLAGSGKQYQWDSDPAEEYQRRFDALAASGKYNGKNPLTGKLYTETERLVAINTEIIKDMEDVFKKEDDRIKEFEKYLDNYSLMRDDKVQVERKSDGKKVWKLYSNVEKPNAISALQNFDSSASVSSDIKVNDLLLAMGDAANRANHNNAFNSAIIDMARASTGDAMKSESDRIADRNALLTAKQKKASDMVDAALARYNEELEEIQNKLRAGMIDQHQFDNRKVNLDEGPWEAYRKASRIIDDPKYKKAADEWFQTMQKDADIAANSGALKKMIEAEQKHAQAYNLADLQLKQGLTDELSAEKKKLSADEALSSVYWDLYQETKDLKFIEEMNELADSIKSWREIIKDQEDELKRQQDMLKADRSLMGQLKSAVGKTGWQRIYDRYGAGMNEQIGAMKLQLSQGIEIPDKAWEDFVKELNEKLASLHLPTIELNLEANTVTRMKDEVKDLAGAWQYASQAIGSVGTALDSLENPAAKVAGIIAGALAEMAAGLGSAIAQKGKDLEPWSWIAFTAASTATFVSTAAAVKKAVEYHAGGGEAGMGSVFVPRGKDTIPAMLAPREEVLPETSWRHQKNIGRYLQGSARQSGGGGGSAQPYVSGEHIWLGLNNYLQRTGRGEIVTSR